MKIEWAIVAGSSVNVSPRLLRYWNAWSHYSLFLFCDNLVRSLPEGQSSKTKTDNLYLHTASVFEADKKPFGLCVREAERLEGNLEKLNFRPRSSSRPSSLSFSLFFLAPLLCHGCWEKREKEEENWVFSLFLSLSKGLDWAWWAIKSGLASSTFLFRLFPPPFFLCLGVLYQIVYHKMCCVVLWKQDNGHAM